MVQNVRKPRGEKNCGSTAKSEYYIQSETMSCVYFMLVSSVCVWLNVHRMCMYTKCLDDDDAMCLLRNRRDINKSNCSIINHQLFLVFVCEQTHSSLFTAHSTGWLFSFQYIYIYMNVACWGSTIFKVKRVQHI